MGRNVNFEMGSAGVSPAVSDVPPKTFFFVLEFCAAGTGAPLNCSARRRTVQPGRLALLFRN